MRTMRWNIEMKRGAACAVLTVVCGCGTPAGAAKPTVIPTPEARISSAGEPIPLAFEAKPAPVPVPVPPAPTHSVATADFGKAYDQPVSLYTLKNKHGLTAKVMTYGATLTELDVPDRTGHLDDVVLGFDNVDDYVKSSPYFGASIGRVANRIKRARFELGGKTYTLAANNPPNHLHGGKRGWDKVIWEAKVLPDRDAAAVELDYVSKNGEEGYPGTVSAKVVYTLTDNDELRVEFSATTDTTTLVNMAHHSYWNLAGQSSNTILDQELTVDADRYTPGDPVPDGSIKPVKGTPFDFSTAKPIGKDLKAAGGKPVGYDLNYVVNGAPNKLRVVAKLKDPKSGRVLTLSADQPGLQVYSGNFLDGTVKGKGGVSYAQYAALCLESQKFPNSINVPAWKDAVVLKPGQTYQHTMVHAFSVE
ncbi:MAG TPA: aldose epimerase family protein [Polyangiaceae bacterium]